MMKIIALDDDRFTYCDPGAVMGLTLTRYYTKYVFLVAAAS